MAYEVFDDNAFNFFMLTILAMILTPWTISKLCDAFGICVDDDETEIRKIEEVKGYEVSTRKEDPEQKPKLFRCCNIIFGILWITILLIFFSLPSGNSLTSYDPFGTLGVEVGASDRDIKKAYRALSKMYHPDKNPGNETASKMFIQISKAYQTLTDPVIRENYEKYGNPDGYQGTSVTLGLPSFLTNQANEFPVLVVYFILMIILPPIGVAMWWKNAKEMGPEGVMHKTVQIYYYFIDKNWSINYVHKFTALYAASAEFNTVLEKICPPRHIGDWAHLKKKIEAMGKKVEFGGKNFMNHPRIQAGSLLLQAHLRRIQVPPVFQKALDTMLKQTDKLIPAMLNTTWRYPGKHFAKPCFAVIEFNQMLIQAMWAHDPIFMQLPHKCEDDIKKKGRKVVTWEKFLSLTEEKKKKIFKDYTEDQQVEIEAAVKEIPQVDMRWDYGVEDEKEIFTEDLVTVDVTLFRKGCCPPEFLEDSKEEVAKAEADKDEDEDEDASDKEEEALDSLDFVGVQDKVKEKKKKRQTLAPYFPIVKHEVWYIILVWPKSDHNKLVADLKRVVMDDSVKTTLRFQVPEKKGKYTYEIHAYCDSYIGCDISRQFQIVAKENKKRKTEDDYQKEKEDREREEEEEVKRMEEEHPAVWYYCYYSSFCEMVLNGIIFALLCVFIFNFLHSRGYWQDYVQPVIEISYNLTSKYVYDLDRIFIIPEVEEEFDFGSDIGGESGEAEM